VRRISQNLRPSELDDLGLAPAVRSLCAEFSERTGVMVDVALSRLPKKILSEVELNIYRIIQEALANIERHARATEVHIRLGRQGQYLAACIRDNGRGFEPQSLRPGGAKQPGMGLVDMRERAAFMGGSCSVHSSSKTGTQIQIMIPMPENAANKKGRFCEKK
jgi:signal transduction histidine kinase